MDFTKHTARIVSRLGETLQYSHNGGAAVPVLGVFSAPPIEMLGTEAFLPTVDCLIADVPVIKHGDTFQRGASVYKVVKKDADVVSGLVKSSLEIQ